MIPEHNDHDLGEEFRALRRADAAVAPSFRATLAAAHARRPTQGSRALGFSVAAIAVAGVVAALFVTRPIRQGPPIDLATVRWSGPTDFLLALPGEELLRTVPHLVTTNRSDWRTP